MLGYKNGTRDWRWRAATLGAALCLAVTLLIVAGWFVNAWVAGTCCYDDASFAVISKNLASGHGYLLSLDYGNLDHRGSHFAPMLGTGPSTIIPGALLVAVFGNRPWVPGFTSILCNLVLMAFICGVMMRRIDGRRVTAFMTVLLVAATALTALHQEQWFAFLGEIQSFWFALAAFCVACCLRPNCRNFLLSGLLLGLSFEAKELAALYVLPFGFMVVVTGGWRAWQERTITTAPQHALLLASAALGTLIPIICFELYRLYSLGPAGWRTNWYQHLLFVHSQGLGSSSDRGALLMARMSTFRERFQIHLGVFTAFPILAVLLASWSTKDGAIRRLGWMLLATMLLQLAYWLFFSNGWPRYAFNAILFGCAAVALPLLYVRRGQLPAVAVILLLSWAVLLQGPVRQYFNGSVLQAARYLRDHSPSDADEQRQVAAYLATYPGVIYAPWWAHIASQEYLAKTVSRFTAITPGGVEREGLLLIHKRLPLPEGEDYRTFAKRCRLMKDFGSQYQVHFCRAR